MKTSRLLGAICAMIFSFISLPSHAALVPELGGQVIYDTDLNITWVADGNLALTNQFGLTLSNTLFDDTPNTVGSGGAMTWDNAQAWIVGMNNANYLGFNDWRLPNTPELDPSCDSNGYYCTGSEMGHLFYNEFGATAHTNVSASGNPTELNKFTNFQPTLLWSGTESTSDSSMAWQFGFFNGAQFTNNKDGNTFALVVRSGGVNEVPAPTALWLFGSGLLGLVGMARRKKAA
jgi:hypothetical protein